MVLKNLNTEQVDALKKIGQTLRDKREDLGFSIETVAEITRISSNMLHSLESAEYREFSSLIFVRGFLRNYCKFLEIDSDWMIQELNQIYDENDHNLDVKISYATPESEQENERSKQIGYVYVFSIIFVMIFLLGGGGYFFYNFYLFNPSSMTQTKMIEMRDTNAGSTKNIAAAQPEARAEGGELNLSVETLDEGWVRVEIDGDKKIEAWLKQGFSYQWKAKERIDLTMSRGDLAKVSLNGKEQYIDDAQNKDKLTQMLFEAKIP